MYNLGNSATYPNGTGYLFTTNDSSNRLRSTIAENGFATEQSVARAGRVPTGQWRHVTFSIDGGTPATPGASRLYEDGVLVATNANLTTNPGLLGTPDGTTTRNVLGRSAYAGDLSFKGRLRDFRIYSRALTDAEAAASAEDTNTAAAEADDAALTLGDTSAVVADLTLPGHRHRTARRSPGRPATPPRSSPTPAPSRDRRTANPTGRNADRHPHARRGHPDPRVRGHRPGRGAVRRGQGAGRGREASSSCTPTTCAATSTLPASGLHGTTFAWSAATPAVVSATGVVTRPAHGARHVTSADRDRHAWPARRRRGPPRPRAAAARRRRSRPTLHLLHRGGHRRRREDLLRRQQGQRPAGLRELNDGQPVLTSEHGTEGLRDPFIIRSPEGDRST